MSDKNGKQKASRVKLASLRTDGGTQARAALDNGMVESCRLALMEGKKLPPVIAFEDEEATRWLADGFHRAEAHRLEGRDQILAEVRKGSKRDAILYAIGANSEPGVLRRTTADKRRAVKMLLADPEWARWSDRTIAQRVGVSPTTVGTVRNELSKLDSCDEPETRIGMDGKERPATQPKATQPPPDEPATDQAADIPADPNTSRSSATPPAPEPPTREPGDDTDEKEKAEEKSRPKNGSVLYDWKVFHDCFWRLYRQMDVVGNAYGKGANGMPHKDTPAAEALRRKLSEFKAAFEEWVNDLKKQQRAKR